MVRFKINTESEGFYFFVYVYDNLSDMREAITKFDKKRDYVDPDNNDDVLGVCQCYERFKVKKGKPDIRMPNIGSIRLSVDHCSSTIISHEVFHAAMQQYRVVYGKANFGTQCSEKEEDIAHIYGELFASMTRKLYKYNIWK